MNSIASVSTAAPGGTAVGPSPLRQQLRPVSSDNSYEIDLVPIPLETSAAPIVVNAAVAPAVASPSNDKKPTFKAARICRTDVKVNCADFLGDLLLIGTDEGLYCLEIGVPDARMTMLSSRRYVQLDVIEEINLVVSRSGKHSIICTHDITSLASATKTGTQPRKKPTKFETETKIKKLKETKDCLFYSASRANTSSGSIYLAVSMPDSILLLKWAPQPFSKFMKMKV